MLIFAIDHSAPATIILISGKGELAYSASLLRHRRYQVVLVVVSPPNVNQSLRSQASMVLDWDAVISQTGDEKQMPELLRSFSPGELQAPSY
jgi:hypothetical protein